MATIKFLGDASATGDTSFWDTVQNSAVASAAVTRKGSAYSYLLNTGAGPSTASVTKKGLIQDAGARISWWVYFPSVTPSVSSNIFFVSTAGGSNVFAIA